MDTDKDKETIALFIDGDNVNKTWFQHNFDEIKLKGRLCIKRIYFDFNNKLDDYWKGIILDNGIECISVTNLPKKNSTDIRLMLDMIREFYNNPIIQTYIIMSSDSDFYHIATFLRTHGKKVICYGEKHTPNMLKNVCDEFILSKKMCIKEPTITFEVNNKSEEELFKQITFLDTYSIDKDLVSEEWKKYPYYREYNNKIYIFRDLIEKIKFISTNTNLENCNLSYLKDLLKRDDPSFTENNWNVYSFSEFIKCFFKKEIITFYERKTLKISKILL
jgi:uncharacterized protein (TIGR00288 family)